jgi:prepilin-type N-terminal cleavage/methylation domain-containing protein
MNIRTALPQLSPLQGEGERQNNLTHLFRVALMQSNCGDSQVKVNLLNLRRNRYLPTRGFSLLEVLISLFILSLGLLGIAGLEIISFRNTQESYWQSVAVTQLTSVFERFHANLSNDKRTQECRIWQQSVSQLLPHASGECGCSQHTCHAALTWQVHAPQALSWQSEI